MCVVPEKYDRLRRHFKLTPNYLGEWQENGNARMTLLVFCSVRSGGGGGGSGHSDPLRPVLNCPFY